MPLDLHVHSTASDGTVAPRDIVRHAAHLGLGALAIADHDSVSGLDAALDEADDAGITLVPAVELSASHEGRSIHVLGYFIEHTREAFLVELTRLRAARLRRAERMVEALVEAGHDLELGDVLRLADGGAVGRSHVARALVDAGHADTVEEAFRRYVGRGKPFYVPKPATPPEDTVRLIREAGGVAVLAHPGVTRVDDLIEMLAAAGLGGLEAFHGEHDAPTRERYARLARDLGLVITGGSDYHGPGQGPGCALGAAGVPDWVLDELREAAGRRGDAKA
ncbi:MAG: PHP domain-containing protein [Coriobacteriia bacterium]|nr:PHP domain-containing protein [Coriobacteriia bacterium]